MKLVRSGLVSFWFAIALVACGAPAPAGDAATGDASSRGPNTSGAVASCTIAAAYTCNEWGGFVDSQRAALMSGCAAPTGAFSNGPCDRANALGGCRVTTGGYDTTTWYYSRPGFTVDAVRSACGMVPNGAFVSP